MCDFNKCVVGISLLYTFCVETCQPKMCTRLCHGTLDVGRLDEDWVRDILDVIVLCRMEQCIVAHMEHDCCINKLHGH